MLLPKFFPSSLLALQSLLLFMPFQNSRILCLVFTTTASAHFLQIPSLSSLLFTCFSNKSIIMFSPPPDISTRNSSNPMNKLVHRILASDSNNIMLAAIISLLVVILFVLLLHVYAKWFLYQARQRSRRPVLVPQVLGASSLHHFHSFAIDTTFATSPSKGLESSVISSIPQFVYRTDEHKHEAIECAICLNTFENEEIGRRLPGCSHAFHIECIDMWLDSHSTCPICRSHPVPDEVLDQEITETMLSETQFNGNETSRMEIIVEVPNADQNENVGTTDIIVHMCSSPSSSSVSSQVQPVSVGDSGKRMMSRNISERMVHPSEDLR